jgi:hypothetical protein
MLRHLKRLDAIDWAVAGLAILFALLLGAIGFARVEHPRRYHLPTYQERLVQRIDALEAWRENHSHQLAALTERVRQLESDRP